LLWGEFMPWHLRHVQKKMVQEEGLEPPTASV
jgi:hypothetical protein